MFIMKVMTFCERDSKTFKNGLPYRGGLYIALIQLYSLNPSNPLFIILYLFIYIYIYISPNSKQRPSDSFMHY